MTSRTIPCWKYFARYDKGTSVRATVLEETEDEEEDDKRPCGAPYLKQRIDLRGILGNEQGIRTSYKYKF